MQIFLAELIGHNQALLRGSEAHHCTRVLRHRAGDVIHCIDGRGNKYVGTIERVEKEEVLLRLDEREREWGEKSCHICLGVSPLRLKDRFEWLVEKAVELGVNEIVPVVCARTFPHRGKWKPARLENILLTATKQCKRSRIPQLHPPLSLPDFLQRQPAALALMGYCEAPTSLKQVLKQAPEAPASVVVLIGPEGDFSQEEVAKAQAAGYRPVHFGPGRLRTETAVAFLLSVLKWEWGY